jgi:hypothetical protein
MPPLDNSAIFRSELWYNSALKEMTMATAKERITALIQQQPDDSSDDEILRELAFHLMVQRGLDDSAEGRTISNEEMGRRIRRWPK